MAISASASFDGTWNLEISAATTCTIQCPTIVTLPFFDIPFDTFEDYKAFCNELRTEEYKKDLFRKASITPIEVQYSQRAINYFIPAKRNFRGKQSSRI